MLSNILVRLYFILAAISSCATQDIRKCDVSVFVYGATPAGIQAALAAAGEGKDVLLATPMPLVGGMMSGGLGNTDKGHASAIGGAALDFFQRVCKYYGTNTSSTSACYQFEPHVAENIFIDLLSDHPGPGKITTLLSATLIATTYDQGGSGGLSAVTLAPTRAAVLATDRRALADLAMSPILSSGLQSKISLLQTSPSSCTKGYASNNEDGGSFKSIDRVLNVSASIFVDASYEGDLLAYAGLRYAVGRESNFTYYESFAGVLFEPSDYGAHQFDVLVDPYQDQRKDKTLKFVHEGPPGSVNSGDLKVQAYNFRLCLTQNVSIMNPWKRPNNYNADDWELLKRYLLAANITSLSSIVRNNIIPNGKTDTNNNGPISTDFIGESYAWPDALPVEREAIFARHKEYTQGFFYFLATDASVPLLVQSEASSWGMCGDEWASYSPSDNWPPQLYVREARRLIGDFVFTQMDRECDWYKDDSVGLFSYNIDSHHVQRYVDLSTGGVINEGDFELFGDVSSAGQMPYRLLLPPRDQLAGSNVLVPVALSASHMGYGCLRLEPQLMILGQAAGVAASLAIDGGTAVHDVNVSALQARLRQLGAKIDM